MCKVMAVRNMKSLQKEDGSFYIGKADDKFTNDVTSIKNNNFTLCNDNKHVYIRDSVSRDSLADVKGRRCTQYCRKLFDTELQEMRSTELWRACFTEFVGTFLLCFYHIGIIIFGSGDAEPPPLLHISFGHGLFVAAVVTALGDTSGCHMNPAVTLALASLRQIGITRAAFYIICQCVGAISGSMLLREVSHPHLIGNLGVISPGLKITIGQVLCTEFIITTFLLMVVVATSDKRRHNAQVSAPLIVGLTIVVNTLIANKISGSCMNPARALGPAVVRGEFANLWTILETTHDCCVARSLDSKIDATPGLEQLFSESLPETHL
ncbi:unnamed protein product [Candidula unifasciata]|uniref:Uncharacterized protein n=1 Tax=Candidula unifasciata TaxID=100452 RepID=A0A8S3Z6E1_9EUPU|nr:unnamed protein product [Candidula unifasciata]